MTCEAKIRALALGDPTLAAIFASDGLGRWFDRQLQPGYIGRGPCVRIRRVSTIPLYSHETSGRTVLNRQSQIRFQIDVLDLNAERARSAASAIIDWLGRVDFSTDAQFASPVTSPKRHANFLLNQRAGMESTTQPPVYLEMLDVRISNLDEE